VARERVGQRVAVAVAASSKLLLVGHRTRGSARAEEASPEASALLVRPVDEPDGQRRCSFLGDAAENLDAGDEVERAVEPPAVRDGVDVPADQKRPIRGARKREPLVPGLVGLFLDPEGLGLSGEPFARPDPRVGPRDALGALFVAGELAELVELVDGAAGGERHGGQLYKLRTLMGRGSRPIKRWRNDRQRKKKERERRRAAEKKAK